MKHLFLLFLSVCLIGQSFAQISSKADLEQLLGKSETLKQKIFKDGVSDYVVTSAYTDNQLDLNHVYIQQSFKRINAYNVIQSLVFRSNELKYATGKFIANLSTKVGSEIPTLTAVDAINKATNHLGLASVSRIDEVINTFAQDKKIVFNTGNIAHENIKTELVWVSVDEGKSVQLAWNVTIAPLNSSDVWHVRVDAQNGNVLEKGNYTVYEKLDEKNVTTIHTNTNKSIHQRINASLKANQNLSRLMAPPTVTSATYTVVPFPNENPYVNGIATETDPWLKSGVGNNATVFGWHNNGGSTNYNFTRGNNVSAYDDSLNKNAPGRFDTSSSIIPSLNFNSAPDFTQEPFTRNNRKFAVTNLFYWNNLMHDVTYQYGFTEPAGNFQNNNNSKGGNAGDFVRAEAQDGLGLDNANFSTQPDGQTARMQMFLWTALKKTGLIIDIPSSSAAGIYTFVESAFSTANRLSATGAITGEVALYNDDAAGTEHRACTVASTNPIAGKIALIYRGGCNFTVKVKNAEDGGAIAVIMVDTLVGVAPIIMGGTDNTITIPAVMITNSDGAAILAALKANETVPATINVPVIGPKFDGDLDAGVITHEYTHGISNRLTGGPSTTSCLNNAEQGGEGWSDYASLILSTDWTKAKVTDDTVKRFIGFYVANQRPDGNGIRRKPYTTDMAVNPHIYSDLSTSTEVHDIGEVWCSALWDMTWALIQKEGINPNIFNPSAGGGNAIAFQLVMTGLKLQPCRPGFLDARNAILAADTLLYGGVHNCIIWQAFANRGMGFSADQGSNTICGDELDGFDVPPCTLPLKLLSFNGSLVENKVALRWNTTAEVNTKQFIVEHSVNNTTWTSVGIVAAKNINGNNEYALTHTQPENGINYYRLKMIDINGSFSYSSIASVKFAGKEGISIYPNPVKETINAELFKSKSEKATVSIRDITGRILVEKQVELQKGFNLIQLNTSELTKGTYLLIVNGTSKTVKQFIKE